MASWTGGDSRAPYGVAQALLSVPWHPAAQVLWIVLPQGSMPVGSKYLFVDAIVAMSSAVFSAIAAALAFLIFCHLGIAVRTALAATVMSPGCRLRRVRRYSLAAPFKQS